MKRLLSYIIPVCIALLSLTACDDDYSGFSSDSGYIKPTVVVDSHITSPVYSDITELGVELPHPGDFNLTLTCADTNDSHTWTSIDDFSSTIRYNVGAYTIAASAGENPRFGGEQAFIISNGETTETTILCRVEQAIFTVVFPENQDEVFSELRATFHSEGTSEFARVESKSTDAVFTTPGTTALILSITMNDGRHLYLNPVDFATEAAHHYILQMSVDTTGKDPVLSVSIPGTFEEKRITLDDELLNGEAPVVKTSWSESSEPISMVEGDVPTQPLTMTIVGENVRNIRLTTANSYLLSHGFPAEIDLLNATEEQLETVRRKGLIWDGQTINFATLLSTIDYEANDSTALFSVLASDNAGRINPPTSLNVIIRNANVHIASTSKSYVGINEATVYLDTYGSSLTDSDIKIETYAPNGAWENAPITKIERTGKGNYAVTFRMPEGTEDVTMRVKYRERIKGSATIDRVQPEYSIIADAFARSAKIKIAAENETISRIVSRMITITANDRQVTVVERDTINGIVKIVGLEPQKSYKIRGTVMQKATSETDYCSAISITTEKEAELPHGRFDEVRPSIDYKDLPSGGRYSQTIVDIFNMQNRVTYKVNTPKGWATTNDKTFCRKAANHNTWYMQPSVLTALDADEGAYTVELVNTAWDLKGPEIPNYTQQSKPYINYNPYIPDIAYRAAGKIWLGSYKFEPTTCTEDIQEGIAFASRPSRLNGYYKYLPGAAPNADKGVAIVKVWGKLLGEEQIIAESRTQLNISPDFTPFSVPLNYSYFGVKATRITVMISASSYYGDISYETANIITYPDPLSATSTGNRLWIENLSFSY